MSRFASVKCGWVTSILILFGLWAVNVTAQSTGRIGGVVSDPSGAIIVGAKVDCRNVNTGRGYPAETTSEGLFQCTELPIGVYDVQVSDTGFQTQVQRGITLLTSQVIDLRITLQLGSVGESVRVTAEAGLVQTASSAVQAMVNERQMQELPLNGRNPLQLVSLTASAQITDAGTFASQQDNRGLSVNGLRVSQNNFRLDGSNYNNRFWGSAPVMPNPDTLEEFSVQSANYSARNFGAGALVELSTRSGTNQFHGSAFEFLRNTRLNARNFFQVTPPPFKLNQYGGTLGGPVRKEKTFFFFSYQGTKQRSSPGTTSITPPTAAQRQGDFSAVSNPVVDPLSGAVFPGNRIPANRLDPLAVKVADAFLPLPNSGINYFSPRKGDVDDQQYLFKLDQEVTSRNRLSGRYFIDNNEYQRPFWGEFFAANFFRNQSLLLRDTHIFSPNLTATLSAAFSRFSRTQEPQAPGKTTMEQLGAKVPLGAGPIGIFPGIRVNISGFVNIFSGGALAQIPTTFDYHGAVSYMRGAHAFQMGVDLQRDRQFAGDYSFTPGSWAFNGQRTASAAVARSGYAVADFYLGLPFSFNQDSGRLNDLRETKYHFWMQDDWKVGRRLTLNLGLRWEPRLPPLDLKHNLVGFVPGAKSSAVPDAPQGLLYPGDSGIGDSLFQHDWNNLAPRIGFAWDAKGDGNLVVRGGYGVFYTDPALTIYTRTVSTQPSALTTNISAPPSFSNPYANYPGGTPYPRKRVQPEEFKTFKFLLPVSGGVLDPAARTGYSQNWNLTIERRLLKDTSASIAYVGNLGVKLLAARQLNPAVYGPGATVGNTDARRIYQNLSVVEVASPYESSNFHSLQINLVKRTRRGLSLLGNYVWSKAIDNASTTLEGYSGPRNPFDFRVDRGPSEFDITQRMNLSGVYDTPKIAVTGWGNVLLNDWQVNVIANIQSGTTFRILSGTDRSLSAVGQDSADLIGDPTRAAGVPTIEQYFNPAAFAPNALGTFGNVGRNRFRGPGRANMDLAVFKNFRIREWLRVQFRAEAFNLQNRTNFGNPSNSVSGGANFGRILSAGDPRVLQFGLKTIF